MTYHNFAPTKTNLMKLREDLKFAQQGYELLDQKRNILVIELLTLVDQTVDHQNKVEELLVKAFRDLEQAVMRTGRLKMYTSARAVTMKTDIILKKRKVMGVPLPTVQTNFIDNPPYFSPLGTSFYVDSATKMFKEVLDLLGKMAELKISVLRLAHEVRKTIKKVNALDKIAIPELKETVSYITNRLEENERDMFVLMKLVKERLEKKRRKSNGENCE